MEIYKDISNYEGLYQISNLGNVKSLKRKHVPKDKILNQSLNTSGYKRVSLAKNGINKTRTVHQLTAIAFLNHVPNGYELVVDHKNAIKTDNRLENLQLITNRENSSKDKKGGASKYTGVGRNKRDNNWRSSIHINGKEKYLGYFKTEIEASNEYQKALLTIKNN